MPELPEVETCRLGIRPYLVNRQITQVIIRQSKLRRIISKELQYLEGETIIEIDRRGKYLLFQLNNGLIVVHLGMSGRLFILQQDIQAGPHDHVDLIADNGLLLRYRDPRKFGSWLWYRSQKEAQILENLGPEPLSDEFNSHYMYRRAKDKKKLVKSWLMDNRLVVGIGNIYANEVLFSASISPKCFTNHLSLEDFARLVIVIKETLSLAIAHGGTTLKDFFQVNGDPGYFSQRLYVYGREHLPCYHCGSLILRIKQNQRSTFYCPRCQRC